MLKRHKKILEGMHEPEEKQGKGKKKRDICEFHRKRGEERNCMEQMREFCLNGPGFAKSPPKSRKAG